MRIDTVLCDTDGTLIEDVPYIGDPDLVQPLATVRTGLESVRCAGLGLAVVSNQSGIARGEVTDGQVRRVMRRVDSLLGPFDAMLWCPHGPADACECRKPRPGLIVGAAHLLRTDPSRCALVGDTKMDLDAAEAAGARAVMVPNALTQPEEISAATNVAGNFGEAIEMLLGQVHGEAGD